MENNLNQKVIRRYSHEFAEKVCASFFSSHPEVRNEQLMEIQPVRQVNLFVAKNLFDEWQQETDRLKSPYFDYTAPKVQEAMEKLQNVLSRHIRLDRNTYQHLLEKSVGETLRLILSPYDYYKELISIDESLLTASYLKATSKYMKVNPLIIHELIKRLERENIADLTHESARQMLDEVVDQLDSQPEDVEPHLARFNEVHPISLEDLFGKERENIPKQAPPETKQEKEVRTLHDNLFNKEQATLADIHQNQKIQDIRKYLTINQRFMFVNKLFEGNADRFNEVIDHIERQEAVDEAIHYLHAAFSEWDRESEEALEFFDIVRRRLG